MNPWPCGFYCDAERECRCAAAVTRYQKRISGPSLDRINIHMEVPRVDYEKLTAEQLGEPSAAVPDRVEAALARQQKRFAKSDLLANTDMRPADVRRHCQLDDESMALLRADMRQLQLSARAFHRILKLARTIANMANSAAILHAHVAEAIQYRPRRRHWILVKKMPAVLAGISIITPAGRSSRPNQICCRTWSRCGRRAAFRGMRNGCAPRHSWWSRNSWSYRPCYHRGSPWCDALRHKTLLTWYWPPSLRSER